jgi:hypothetical protein
MFPRPTKGFSNVLGMAQLPEACGDVGVCDQGPFLQTFIQQSADADDAIADNKPGDISHERQHRLWTRA